MSHVMGYQKVNSVALVTGVLVFLVLASACASQRRPCVYELPNGYVGWVLIEFEREDAPPLSQRDGKWIFPISKSGNLATSSKCEFGWAQDEYAYVDGTRVVLKRTASGGGGKIWGGSNGFIEKGGRNPQSYQTFFVGSETEFHAASREPKPVPR